VDERIPKFDYFYKNENEISILTPWGTLGSVFYCHDMCLVNNLSAYCMHMHPSLT
jgi:hypothetical protein